MATKNNVTGDEIKTSSYSEEGRRNHDRIFAKKPATEWAKEDGVYILDADGFDRVGEGVTVDTPISYKEFSNRINYCTITGLNL
jgi:hypothetical protein